ncbi:MAG: hypothetical protein RMJ56_17170 [Gemmataceae bacterium]|nr:hypothetical protein [Gemmata sp.]MDW8199328.1 hypothetical protein [Gemmataceae bacterium]
MAQTLRLKILETQRTLVIARGGRLQPWLGPALRGLAGGRLKAQVCRQPVRLQLTQWRYCHGCPLRRGCAYGETIEGGDAAKADPARPIVIAPLYPCPEFGQLGDRIPVTVRFIGPMAAAHADVFWEAVRRGGADPGLGLGEDHVLFDVLPGEHADRWQVVELPDPDTQTGWLPAVRVVLTSPLILHSRKNGPRHLIHQPTLTDLLQRWENLVGLFEPTSVWLAHQRIARLLQLAAITEILDAALEPVGQVRRSQRSGERWHEEGIFGWLKLGPIACGVLPWLEAAGQLHIGTHRSGGAGGWRVVAETGNAPRQRQFQRRLAQPSTNILVSQPLPSE